MVNKTCVNVDGIGVGLVQLESDVRIITLGCRYLCGEQNIEEIENHIRENYQIVYKYYLNKAEDLKIVSDEKIEYALKKISVLIVVDYIHLYSSWQRWYPKSKYNLSFKKADFTSSSTFNIIVDLFKNEHPDNWVQICCVLMDMDVLALKGYIQRRKDYSNR